MIALLLWPARRWQSSLNLRAWFSANCRLPSFRKIRESFHSSSTSVRCVTRTGPTTFEGSETPGCVAGDHAVVIRLARLGRLIHEQRPVLDLGIGYAGTDDRPGAAGCLGSLHIVGTRSDGALPGHLATFG